MENVNVAVMEPQRDNVGVGKGSYSCSGDLRYNGGSLQNSPMTESGLFSSVKERFTGLLGGKRRSDPRGVEDLKDFKKFSSNERDSESGWLNYFTQRTFGSSVSFASNTQTHQVKRPRKIIRTYIGGKEAIENPSPLREFKPRAARFQGIKRSVSLPADSMEKLHLNLKRSASSKAVLRQSSRYDRNAGSGGFRTHEERIIEQTKDFCRDIIIQTLKRNNMFNRVKISRPPTCDHWVAREVQMICNELERRNPCLCKNISKQIGITLRSEEVLRKVFFEFAREIILTDKEENRTEKKRESISVRRNSRLLQEEARQRQKTLEITWGRIMGIFVAAGAFAIDCIKQGHSELVGKLVEVCGEFFVEEGVSDWIVNQGGWEILCEVNSTRVKEPDTNSACHILLLSACVFASVALGVGLSNLTAGGGG